MSSVAERHARQSASAAAGIGWSWVGRSESWFVIPFDGRVLGLAMYVLLPVLASLACRRPGPARLRMDQVSVRGIRVPMLGFMLGLVLLLRLAAVL